jgi:hypothetical protein
MRRSIGARLLAANQRPGSVATFVVTNAPDVRITAWSAGLHGDAALLGERVATVALCGRGAIALRLFGAAAAARFTRSTRTLLAVADAGTGRRRCVEKARPRLGRRRRPFTARAPRRCQPRCQRCLRPNSVGELRERHVCNDTREPRPALGAVYRKRPRRRKNGRSTAQCAKSANTTESGRPSPNTTSALPSSCGKNLRTRPSAVMCSRYSA